MQNTSTTDSERARQYRRRIKEAGKESLRLVVSREVADQLRASARKHVVPVDRVLAKALAALEEIEATAPSAAPTTE